MDTPLHQRAEKALSLPAPLDTAVDESVAAYLLNCEVSELPPQRPLMLSALRKLGASLPPIDHPIIVERRVTRGVVDGGLDPGTPAINVVIE